MNWNDLPAPALETMKSLGNFSPTSNCDQKMVKGYVYEDGEVGKCYLNANDLRDMAQDLIVVADWLDKRAEAA